MLRCSAIFDPCGNVLAECTHPGEDIACATLSGAALGVASGSRYIKARRPELYAPLVVAGDGPSETRPAWVRSWENRPSGDDASGGAGS
jgi:hypothetical protein